MSTTAEKIAVMQAFERGEKLEVCYLDDPWQPLGATNPRWDWSHCNYRIARKPRTAKVMFIGSVPYEVLNNSENVLLPHQECVHMVEVIK